MTSSSDFWPKFVMASRSSSVFCEQLADRVDLGPLEAVAGTLGQVEVLDRQVEVGRAGGGGGRPRRARGPAGSSLISATRATSERSVSPAEASASRGRDRAVGLDVEDEAVVVRVDCSTRVGSTSKATRRTGEKIESTGITPMVWRRLVAVGGHVAPALRDGDVDGEAALAFSVAMCEVGVEDLDVGVGLDVGRR